MIDYSELVAFRGPNPGEVPSIVAENTATYGSGNNLFKIVNQLEIIGYEKRIPDGILYINGLPLVVFEFESAIRGDASTHDASVQLTRTRFTKKSSSRRRISRSISLCEGAGLRGSLFLPDADVVDGEVHDSIVLFAGGAV
ncbi:type I restriction endonuclease [Luteolibacter algae]|uniref:Type I restriction endonuclease n=1 Tax=Luteolibacter algae TaxID=454151 RepID=A0ABW5D6U8_9BACT